MNTIKDALIVTATLGNRDTIARTIQSVKNIGGYRVRHIIITPIANFESLKVKYPDSEIILEPSSCRGIYQSLNYVFNKFGKKYQILGFINDDDYWLPEFAKCFKVMDTYTETDVVYGKVIFVNENNKIIGEQTSSPRFKAFGALLTKQVILFTQQATLIRSELFFKLKGFDESYKLIADSDFWLEAIKSNAKFHFLNLHCAAYMIQSNQLSSNKSLQKSEREILLQKVDSKGYVNVLYEYLLFRAYNFPIYLKRFIRLSKLKPTLTN